MSQSGAPLPPLKTVGHTTRRIDAVERVTGKANYTGDVRLPGMLYARILRSPHPHARVRRVDTAKAAALAGVKAIITHENAPVWWGAGSIAGGAQYNDDIKKITTQRRYIFNNPVRFVGDAGGRGRGRRPPRRRRSARSHPGRLRSAAVRHRSRRSAAARRGRDLAGRQSLAERPQRSRARATSRRGNVDEGFAAADQVFEDRYSTAFVHDAQMEPRACLAHWEGDKLTLYTPTGGIANCRHDTARDLGIPDDKVRVVCQYMGGNFGNKNQNQDADLIAAMLAKQAARTGDAGAVAHAKTGSACTAAGTPCSTTRSARSATARVTAIQLRGYSGMGGYRKNSGAISGLELYDCPNAEIDHSSGLHQPDDVRELPRAIRPAGLLRHRVDDGRRRVQAGDRPGRVRDEEHAASRAPGLVFTNYSLDECIRRGAALFDWKKRWRPQPGSDPGPIKRGAGMSFMMFRSGLGPQQRGAARRRARALHAVCRRHRRRRRREDDDGHDCRRGARRAALAGRGRLGRHRSLSVLGRRVRQPHHDHDRLRGRRGGRATSSGRSPRKGMPAGDERAHRVGRAQPRHRRQGAQLLRRALRGGRSRHRARHGAHLQIRRRPRVGPHHESADGEGSDPRRGAAGHRPGAARGSALRPPQRPAAHRRLLRRART